MTKGDPWVHTSALTLNSQRTSSGWFHDSFHSSFRDSAWLTIAPLERETSHRNGKKVTVVLQSGTELSGKVKDVGNNTLTLSELSGKELFDAVVDLDDISAVQFRAREN